MILFAYWSSHQALQLLLQVLRDSSIYSGSTWNLDQNPEFCLAYISGTTEWICLILAANWSSPQPQCITHLIKGIPDPELGQIRIWNINLHISQELLNRSAWDSDSHTSTHSYTHACIQYTISYASKKNSTATVYETQNSGQYKLIF